MLLGAVSCAGDREVSRRLSDVEDVLEARPDSALALLDGIDRSALGERNQARYDYLSARAFYGTYFFLDDRSDAALQQAYQFKERQRLRTGNLALLVVAILSTLILYLWARRIQAERLLAEKQAESDRLMSIAEDLRSRLSSRGDKKTLPGLDMLDRLCEQYYVFEGTDALQPRILSEVRSVVEGFRSDPKVQKTLEHSLDASGDGVMRRLRAAFPKWKEEDFLLYAFTASGFSSTTISTLLEKDKPYVYNRIYRLKERIRSSGVEDREFFLSFLGK